MFYFQTDFNLRFKRKRDVRLTCSRIWCILHRTLSLTWPRRRTSHIIAQIDFTSCFKNTSFEWNKTHQTLTDHRSKCAKRGKHEMCNFGSCKTRFEFLSQFRKVRNAFQCFVTQVQTRLPKSKCVWPMKINVICTVGLLSRDTSGTESANGSRTTISSICIPSRSIFWAECFIGLVTSASPTGTLDVSEMKMKWWCFWPLLCTLFRLNWAKQTPGIMRRN